MLGNLRGLTKRGKDNGHDDSSVNFMIVSIPYFTCICRWYTLELPDRGNSNVYLQHMSSLNGISP